MEHAVRQTPFLDQCGSSLPEAVIQILDDDGIPFVDRTEGMPLIQVSLIQRREVASSSVWFPE